MNESKLFIKKFIIFNCDFSLQVNANVSHKKQWGKLWDRTVPSWKNDEIFFVISIKGFLSFTWIWRVQDFSWIHDELERYNPFVQYCNWNHDDLEKYNPCVQGSSWNHEEPEKYNPCVQGFNWNHDDLERYNPCVQGFSRSHDEL